MEPNPQSRAAPSAPILPDEGAEEIEVSVVLPCLNEAEGVGICVEKAWRALRSMGVSAEVIVVDNGSTDGSPEVAERAGALVVHERRRGYGSAYLRGFAEARGRFLVMGDADDTYDFLAIPSFIAPLREQGFDMVMGSRLKGKILPGAMPWSHRWIGNPILSGMLRLFFRTSVSDSHCGMRAFTREAYERMRLHTTGMELASEMVVNALREKLRIQEIPITYHPRIGESKLSGFRDAWRHVRFMLLFSPSYLFQLPGFLLMILGALLVVLLAGGPREIFGRTWDYHVLIFGALALILGYNLILFDVFAKTFSMGADFARPGQWLRRLMGGFSLERGLILGGLLFLAGLGLEVKIVLDWLGAGAGALMAVRGVVIGMTGMVMGAQTVFASFLVSLMLIPRR
ncbi:MAG TPA: glycosyltransferase family 2 protein [Thermoanaerobaculia bacterium]|nr:glycosyltransferase family 2 protein [Thermoanaerobaculia bacterium]